MYFGDAAFGVVRCHRLAGASSVEAFASALAEPDSDAIGISSGSN